MYIYNFSFCGKPKTFPSPKTQEKITALKVLPEHSDNASILEYNLIKSARNKLRDIETAVVLLANSNSKAEKTEIKKDIRKTLNSAIGSLDKVLKERIEKFNY